MNNRQLFKKIIVAIILLIAFYLIYREDKNKDKEDSD